MLRVGQKTDEYVRIRALIQGTTDASKLANETDTDFISGEEVVRDNILTPAALRVAIRQIGKRTDDSGVRFPIPRSFQLVVARGMRESAEWAIGLAQGMMQVQDGVATYRTPSVPAEPVCRLGAMIDYELLLLR